MDSVVSRSAPRRSRNDWPVGVRLKAHASFLLSHFNADSGRVFRQVP